MRLISISLCALAMALSPACKSKKDEKSSETSGKVSEGGGDVGGAVIQIDGSSTVFPITQAVAEEFQAEKGGRVTVGVSGTGGGFKKFCRGEIALTGASRPIRSTELEQCKSAGIEFVELPVAYDGLAVVVHKSADWVDKMTVEELKIIWAPEADGKIKKWNQVRASWPDRELHLLGPGVDSGTYDYFTAAVVGTEHSSRSDFNSSEDDNVLVKGVISDEGALAYFGYAYYLENKDQLKLVPIDDGNPANGDGAILPSLETVGDGTYQPLSRPIFVYVSTKALERPEVKAFADFYLQTTAELAKEVGYIPLPAKAVELASKRLQDKKTGTIFEGGSKIGLTVEQLLSN